jgi:hypothetical protein
MTRPTLAWGGFQCPNGRMPSTITTELVRDGGVSVIASDIPERMTLAQYRKRAEPAPASPWKKSIRLLKGHR